MKNMKKWLSLFLAGTLAAGMLAGCGGSDNSSASSASGTSQTSSASASSAEDTGDGEMDSVQELNLVFTDLKTLDVNDVRNANEFQVLSQVQEGLFRTFTDEDGNAVVENAGCEDYTVSDDGLVYTFTLRDHQWSDGQPVTAQNYVDSIKRLLNPENAFAYAFLAYDIENAEAYYNGEASADDIGVRAIDDKTLEIRLQAALPFFIKKLTNVCFFPVRLDVIEAGGESYATDYTKQVYNGPFVIESRILDNEMVLAKNENYWHADNVHLDKVTLKVVAEPATQSQLLESKELDVVEAASDYISRWQSMVDEGTLVSRSVVKPSSTYMVFNQHTGGTSGLMNNAKVRLALSLAIDREELNEVIYSGQNTPAYGLIPYNMMSGDVEFRSEAEEPLTTVMAEYDTDEKIVDLFTEGVEEEGKSVSDVELTVLSSAPNTQGQAFLEYMQQTWQDMFGITVTLNICPDSATFVSERDSYNYDTYNMGWNGDYDDPMTFMELWNTDSGYAKFMGGYSNAEFDEMFNSLSTMTDTAERTEVYKEMEQNLVAENAGMAPLYYGNSQFFVQEYVKNLSTPNFGAALEFSRAYISGKE